MPDPVRQYFDNKVPLEPGDPSFVGPPAPVWQKSLAELAKQFFTVLPRQLDRSRSFRNRFTNVVR